MSFVEIAVCALALLNVVVFMVYAWDKWCARKNKWRLSERTLLLCSLLGPIGAVLAVFMLRHKIQKPSYLFKLFFIVTLGLVAYGFGLYVTYN